MFGYETKVVHSYTARQAVADGVLLEVDAGLCRTAGFAVPVRLTCAVRRLIAPPGADEKAIEDRLWHALSMARIAIGNARPYDFVARFDVQFGERSVTLFARLDTTSGPAVHLTKPEETPQPTLYRNGSLGQRLYAASEES